MHSCACAALPCLLLFQKMRYRFLFLFLLLTVFYSPYAQLPAIQHHFVVIAHRGDHTAAPENTLAAFQHAIDNGADYVEIDLRTTKDGQLVIMHDGTIDRMTNGKGKISELSLSALQQYQVQNRQHPEWGLHPIPRFAEVLALCKGKINIYLDFKDASPAAAYREILQAGTEKSVVVYINAPAQFTSWRAVAPGMPLMISLPHSMQPPVEMRRLLDSVKVDILDGSFNEYSAEMIKIAAEKQVPVWPDIQSPGEGPELWEKALLLHPAGLQTDHPAALISFLQSKGIR